MGEALEQGFTLCAEVRKQGFTPLGERAYLFRDLLELGEGVTWGWGRGVHALGL